MNVDLQGKKVLIVGGTGTLGDAMVKASLENGAQTYFTFCSNEKSARVLQRAGAHSFQLDLFRSATFSSCAEWLCDTGAYIDIVINNAVVVHDDFLVTLDEHAWDEVLEVGLYGIQKLSRLLMPLIKESSCGKIINIVSQVGVHGAAGQSNYAAAKGGLIDWTRALAKEMGVHGIAVNGVNPGFMLSAITKGLSQDVQDVNREKSCLHTYSDPEEVARFVVYLVSDYVSTVSGQIFDYESRLF